MIRRVLIVDDELDIQSSLSFALKDEGYEVRTASSPMEALEVLEQESFHVSLYDVWFPEGDGMELLKQSLEMFPAMSIIMMSGHGNIELALKSIRMGAYDFLEKPLELEKVLVLLRNACQTSLLKFENKALLNQLYGDLNLIALSRPMQHLKSQIEKVAPTPSHVLLSGESGVGKTLAARFLHGNSDRSQHPFVAVHCAALPEDAWEKELFGYGDLPGRLELAAGGTLYLNSVGELPAAAQARLFRVLEEKRFERKGRSQSLPLDVRLVASSSTQLSDRVAQGSFREDLYFQLKVVALDVPALRDRKEDVDELAQSFLQNVSKDHGRPAPQLSPEFLQWMRHYDWPGNVREMKNLLERCLILSSPQQKTLGLGDLPEDLATSSGLVHTDDTLVEGLKEIDLSGPLRELRARFESSVLRQRLDQHGGNVTKAAESLGIERAHLHRKLKQYGLGAS
jgi:two-component system, NtrC family, nitrogen regulation response regulator NtrX